MLWGAVIVRSDFTTRAIVTDKLRLYRAAMKEISNAGVQETGRYLNNRAKIPTNHFR